MIQDMLQALRADRETCHIPVVGCSWLDEEASALAAGVNGYLQKPILYDDFLAVLESTVSKDATPSA